jgi:hypothetical protein
VARRAEGTFAIKLSERQAEGNWIPVTAGPFNVTIRLYNPQGIVVADPAQVQLPAIRRESCN